MYFNFCLYVTASSAVTQVGLYHDQQTEDGGSSKENRNIYSESMPRRVGSFYRGRCSRSASVVSSDLGSTASFHANRE